jgi:hypothetical protein
MSVKVSIHERVWLASPAGLGFQWVKLVRVWNVTSRPLADYIYIYTRAWLPRQASRGGLASQTRTCMGTLTLIPIQRLLFVCLETCREIHSPTLCNLARIYLQPYVSINIRCDANTDRRTDWHVNHCGFFGCQPCNGMVHRNDIMFRQDVNITSHQWRENEV